MAIGLAIVSVTIGDRSIAGIAAIGDPLAMVRFGRRSRHCRQ